MTSTPLRIVVACFLAFFLAACQHTNERLILSSKPAVELRAMQSRAFETTDQPKMLRVIVATLQDLGYKIDKVEPAAGSITATKLAALRLTASVYPRGTTQLMVRSNAQVKLPQQQQQRNVETQVDDPEFYQKLFFEPLSKAVFLTALQVEDDTDSVAPPNVATPDKSANPVAP